MQPDGPFTPDPSPPKRGPGEEDKLKGSGVAHLLIWLLMAATLAAVLASLGRVWWCGCGSAVPWAWDVNSQHNSQHLCDPYFFSHLQHGLLLFLLLLPVASVAGPRWRWFAALLIEAGWEVLENTPLVIERYRAGTISLDYYGDSIANSLSDLTACAAGYLLARCVGRRWVLVVFVAIELAMIVLIRDSLLLNILMLLYPLDAVRGWQAG